MNHAVLKTNLNLFSQFNLILLVREAKKILKFQSNNKRIVNFGVKMKKGL